MKYFKSDIDISPPPDFPCFPQKNPGGWHLKSRNSSTSSRYFMYQWNRHLRTPSDITVDGSEIWLAFTSWGWQFIPLKKGFKSIQGSAGFMNHQQYQYHVPKVIPGFHFWCSTSLATLWSRDCARGGLRLTKRVCVGIFCYLQFYGKSWTFNSMEKGGILIHPRLLHYFYSVYSVAPFF